MNDDSVTLMDDAMLMDMKMARKLTPICRMRPKIGRNEKCPCGSGKKYKMCCLFNKKG